MSKWSAKLRKIILPLSLAFSSAALAPPIVATPLPPDPAPLSKETLWKTEYLDTVISLRECAENNVCGYIYWVNPNDTKIYDYFGDPRQRFNLPASFSLENNPPPSATDILSVCGHSPKTDFRQVADKKWQGTMELRGMNMTVKMNVTQISDDELKVVSKFGLFSKTETWRQVPPGDLRYPKCAFPAPRK